MFATSSRNDVRVWHAVTGKELLRIEVANLQCNAVEITPDARAIITGQYIHSQIKRPYKIKSLNIHANSSSVG